MCIKKVEAWGFEGKTYPTEGRAINAAIAKHVGNDGIAQSVMDKASVLIPLLQRVVEIEAEKNMPSNAVG